MAGFPERSHRGQRPNVVPRLVRLPKENFGMIIWLDAIGIGRVPIDRSEIVRVTYLHSGEALVMKRDKSALAVTGASARAAGLR